MGRIPQPIKFGTSYNYSNPRSGRTKLMTSLIVVVVVGIIGGGLYTAHRAVWLFTPAYSQRKMADSFMSNVLAGKDSQAYALTSDNLQTLNSPTQFQQSLSSLQNNQASVTSIAYKKKDSNSVVVAGVLTDKTNKQTKLFGLTVVSGGKTGQKVDSVTVVDGASATAIKSQVIALLQSK